MVYGKENEGWSFPKALPSNINSVMKEGDNWPLHYESGPFVDEVGNLFYWTKGANAMTSNIWYARVQEDGQYAKPVEVFPVSSNQHYDTAPVLSPDGKVLFFCSDNRPGGFGDTDILYSLKLEDGWTKPLNLGPVVNSPYAEGFPSFSPDGKSFYFSSNRGEDRDENGERVWNIYHMESRFLLIENYKL